MWIYDDNIYVQLIIIWLACALCSLVPNIISRSKIRYGRYINEGYASYVIPIISFD